MANGFLFSRLLIFLLVLSSFLEAAGIKESWYLMRGKSNMKIGNYKAAIEAYEKAVEINPKNKEAQLSLGLAYEKQGLMDKAVSQYEQLLKIFKKEYQTAFKLGDVLQWKRYQYRKKDAIKYYEWGLKYKNDLGYRYKLARLYSASDESLTEAIKHYQIILKEDGKNAKLWKEYAMLWTRRPGDYKQAIKAFEQALAFYPNDHNLRYEYANALSRDRGEYEKAKKEYQKLLSQRRSLKVLKAYGNHLAKKNSNREKALDVYEEILNKDPGDTNSRIKYANLLGSQKKNSKKAIAEYKKVLRSEPSNAKAHAGLARMYAWNEEPKKARQHASLAAKYNPGSSEIKELKSDLNKGREPEAYGKLESIYQPGEGYGLFANRFTGNIQVEINTELLLSAHVGGEQFANSKDGEGGMLLGLEGRYFEDKDTEITGSINFHSAPKLGDGLEFKFSYLKLMGKGSWGAEISRNIVYESYLSIIGDTTYSAPGQAAQRGGARAQFIRGNFYYPLKIIQFGGQSSLGWVSSIERPSNFTVNTSFFGRAPKLLQNNSFDGGLGYEFYFSHFATDNSGLSENFQEPYGGGYFSPQVFLSHAIPILISADIFNGRCNLEVGPVFQFVNDASTIGEYGIGLMLKSDYKKSFARDYFVRAGGQFNQIATAYSRFSLSVDVGKTF